MNISNREPGDDLLDVRQVTVERPGAPALRFGDFQIGQGEKLLLLGPSGCGKTTLLSVVAGLLAPASGTVMFQGRNLYTLSGRARDHLRGRQFGFVFQTLHLLPSLTLRQNIALAADMSGASDPARIDTLLSTLGLTDKANRKPDALSQGEQQRAAIARAVLNRPALIIADEPTSALDDANAAIVVDLLEQQAQDSGAALLIATHDNRITSRFSNIVNLGTAMRQAA